MKTTEHAVMTLFRAQQIPRLLLEIVLAIFVCEIVVMLVMPYVALGIGGTSEAIFDAVLLSALSGPLIFWRFLVALRNFETSISLEQNKHAKPEASREAQTIVGIPESNSKPLVYLISLLVLGALAFSIILNTMLERIRVGGTLYDSIVEQKDIVADVLPPPEVAAKIVASEGDAAYQKHRSAIDELTILSRAKALEVEKSAEAELRSGFVPMVIVLGLICLGSIVTLLLWMLGATRDKAISLAKQMTLELRASEEEANRLAEVAKRTTNAVIITDANRRITWANEGFTRVTGYSLEEVIGESPGKLLQFERSDKRIIESMKKALDLKMPFRGTLLNRGKTGREYWIDINLQPQFDDREELTGFIAVESDVTEQVLVQERLRSTFAAVAEGILLLDDLGRVVECNPEAEHLFECTVDNMKGKRFVGDLVEAINEDGEHLSHDNHPVNLTLKHGKGIRDCVFGVRLPGDLVRWLSASTQPILNAEGNLDSIVASFTDITSLKQTATELIDARIQAQEANAAKSEFCLIRRICGFVLAQEGCQVDDIVPL